MRKGKTTVYRLWLFLFGAGFLSGILLMNLGSDFLLGGEAGFGENIIDRLKYVEVDNGKFFMYVMWERSKSFLFLGVMSTTYFGIAVAYFYLVWQGLLMGCFMAAALIRFGTKGMLLMLAGLFPHQLLLLPALLMMVYWCYQNCCFLYYPAKCAWPAYRSGKVRFLRQGIVLLWIGSVVLIGCVLECYVNPILVSEILKIF